MIKGPCPDGRYYICDVVRGQWEPHERNNIIKRTAAMDGTGVKIIVPKNPGDAGVDQANMLVQMLAGYAVEAQRETGSKEFRAEPYAAQVNAGNIVIVQSEWTPPYVEELRTFPGGKNDDQVDASANGFNDLALGPSVTFSF